ncbi:hypothetical protein Y032_0230g2953 [Ancylostoma ceylanicum]|uniref:Uncharacterized protein n=1 Tax=Ancylostoma ceylanicum TaxID=53326 RepID=A0A016SFU0_9BILA|nr:hypothetical protein Y032_0230g2953 [Ancylostoma ceylanicum]
MLAYLLGVDAVHSQRNKKYKAPHIDVHWAIVDPLLYGRNQLRCDVTAGNRDGVGCTTKAQQCKKKNC